MANPPTKHDIQGWIFDEGARLKPAMRSGEIFAKNLALWYHAKSKGASEVDFIDAVRDLVDMGYLTTQAHGFYLCITDLGCAGLRKTQFGKVERSEDFLRPTASPDLKA